MLEKLLPHAYLEKIEEMLVFSGNKKEPESFIEKAVLVSLIAGLGAALLFQSMFLIAFGAAFIFVFLMMHGFLILAVEKAVEKKCLVEENLALRKELLGRFSFNNIIGENKRILEMVHRAGNKRSHIVLFLY